MISSSSQTSVSDIERLLIENQIRTVLTAYCHGLDRKDWDLVRRCYHENAHDSHGTFSGSVDEMLTWMHGNHEHVTSSLHVLTNVSVWLADDGKSARSESYCLSMKRVESAKRDAFMGSAASDEPVHRTVACRYIDDFDNLDGNGWRIRNRVVAIEWTRRDDSQSFLPLDESWVVSRRDRKDVVYATLASSAADSALSPIGESDIQFS
ncbi:nuclear transport factor 2 family protein [Arthrobacter sp. FW306-2-2C-D06B]|uniref:nuclear transport factor 2 family protein n=1 Tax=Arthrobacter sp. FW306-2-2C-D06B TaxID=2879618 RepID=UPI001F43DCD7|nr:nuclear transport factor 2 family protein [Arthrobacter sp. FW306-2-2C-D06B]UKA60422.1 nuclear transport factor 2 family protein [Arthrobacter sp. FW306-2-2C-D06B]